MAKKYYCVRVGRNPGIYDNWDDCKKEVDGFNGAEYKGFNNINEANDYMGTKTVDNRDIDSIMKKHKVEAVAYVDGSYDNLNKSYGYGAVIFHGEITHKISGSGNEEGMAMMRNVAGEIESAMKTVDYCIENKIKSLLIFHDYEGIGKWADKKWKTNLRETRNYKEYIAKAREVNKLKIEFKHVKGHSGNKYNEMADKLAREALSK
ncbi:MAG TPA: ribonuclease H family protein [Anaerovoracaceae bacterium]|nr:ribonuclease H family protein [Anaerovoracaceae bacterium]